MELFQREPGDGNYHSIPGNSPAPWHKRRAFLAGIAVLILFAVIVTIVALCAPTKENSEFTSRFSALEWIDDCPKSTPVCPSSYEEAPPLLLVSLDGFRPDYLKRGLSPTLARLSRCGVRAPYMMSVFPTKTFPNHFSQVTGLYPSSHGIIDNFMIDPETGKIFKISTNSTMESFWWEKEPIWVSVVKQGKKSATYFWPGSDVEINATRPTYYKEYNGSIPFEVRVDQVLEWLDLPLSERPSFLTLYISDVDSSAHNYGIYSQQVNASLSIADQVIERLFSGLQQRNLTGCVNVFIVSDHGMANIDCSRSINLGKYVDLSCVRSTEGSVGRLQLMDCQNTTLEQVVKDIQCRNEHMRVYRKELLPVRAHYVDHPRIEPIFLDLDSGWTLLRREPREGEYRCSGGSHGYDNIFPDMKAFFMALGPSMKKHFTVEPFINIELYELMCEILDITPNPNNGTKGSLHHLLRKPLRPLLDEEEPQPPAEGVAEHEPADAQCPCPLFIDPKVDVVEVRALHLPFGVPYSPQGNNSLLLLHNVEYVVAYSTSLRMAEWVGFALASKNQSFNRTSPDEEICWTDDARVPNNAIIKCTDYNFTHVEEPQLSQRPFYHPDLSDSSDRLQSTFVTNSVPKSFLHLPLEESMMQILDQWTSRGKSLHVFTGPAFDFRGTGLRPNFEALQDRNGSLLIPTHLFYVITWCWNEVKHILDCNPHDLRVCSFLLPNWPFPVNCESAEQNIKKNVARAVDVEKLTGLSFYLALPAYEAVRLKTALPETPFPL